MCHSERSEESLYSAIDRDVSIPLRSIAPSEPLRVGEACLKDIRHDILALLGVNVANNFVHLLTFQTHRSCLSCAFQSTSAAQAVPAITPTPH